MKRVLVAVMTSLLMVSFAHAQTKEKQLKGTKEESVAMVEKAVDLYKKVGRDKAFEAINDPKGDFQYMDLYVWVIDVDSNGLCLARPIFKQLIGQELCDFVDAEGKYFMREACATAKTKGKGWIDYSWANPVTKRNEPKSTYFECVKNICFFCGYYK